MSAKSGEPTAIAGGDGEATGNSEGGTTVALQKKRLRRVSFAENTSVRFFDRDDDENETPEALEESASKVGNNNDSEEIIELLGFRQLVKSKGGGEEDREDGDRQSDDEERVDMRRSFLRPVESPSSESGFGSATSNDEDNFFGPVSASFIRPDRLSDSGASDLNHDVTMDSTAFSMHFRSLARSDSGIDLKTPTESHLSFEEKTPTQTNIGSSMEITVPKKLISLSSSPIVNEGGGSSSSSDMSLVGGSPASYDYGRLSPALDALLGEGSKNLNMISDSDIDVVSGSRGNYGSKFFPERENGDIFVDVTKNGKAVSKGAGEANSRLPISPVAHATPASDILIDKTKFSPNKLIKERTFRPVMDDKLGQADGHIQNESPLVDFISSPAKRREALTSCASPLKSMSALTPQEERSSFRGTEIIKQDSTSSIQKSISKLRLLEASPFAFLGAEKRNIKPHNITDSYPFNILSEKEMNNFQMKELSASSTDTESQLLRDSLGEGAQVSNFNIKNNQIEDSGGGNMPQTEEVNVVAISPSQLICPGKEMEHDLFRSKDPNDDVLVTAGIDSSSAETTLDYIRAKNLTGTPQISVPCPDKGVQKKLTASPELLKLSKDLVLHDRFVKLKNFSPGRNLSLQGSALDENLFTEPLGRSGYFSIGREVHPSSPASAVCISNLIEVNSTVAKNGNDDDGNVGTGVTERSQFLHNRELDGNLQFGIGLSRSSSELHGGEPEDVSNVSSVPSVWRNLKELTFPKNLLDSLTPSPARKAFEIVGRDNTCEHPVEDVLFPTSNQMKSSLKRRNRVIDFEDRQHRNEVAPELRSPKLLKVGCKDVEMRGYTSENFGERSVEASKHWTDIYSKFSHDAERLFTLSKDKLNLSVIDLLEGFLFQLKKLKMYEMVGTGIFTQKTSVRLDQQTERAGGTRMLLHQILHERSKLQLMRAKQQRLLGKLQKLSQGNQESQMLKQNFLSQLRRGAQADILGLQNFVHVKQRDEVTCEKVAAIKQALESLDRKKAKFTKALQSSCKIKGELSCVDSVSLVNDHLMKESRHRFIRQDMQMWVVDDVQSKSGHHDIALNYLDLIIQRVQLTVGTVKSIVISNKVDDAKIRKIFPNMDACKAFSVVLNAESTRKYFGCRSLAQEIQVTSSLLGNLVDVVRELQMAQIELRNLTDISFHCPLVGQLNLHLSFFSFKSGKKVSLIFNMSSLNRGVYPSDILPSQLTAFKGMNNTSGDPIIGEIRDAFKSLRAGYMRIIRLCRCISLVVQG
ncbi:uncharacterized protein LOC113772334 isoform X1 [Coffea eugenioides]|uniref:Uncharacterized protein isoform X1 n=1 Tax=Coffea arabica TaxID=13443 RepID=A0A6P6S7P5_COFAR|nr:uncharacterized protein LOC113688530 isoform X2 [Coffea arabica]XP_027172728.1 uncharacterized protein LOC113772334 isoform X1 [Coffea eugenioides]